MTITFPDAAAASAIMTVAAAIVWAIKVITNKQVQTLEEQASITRQLLPILQDAMRIHQETNTVVDTIPGQLVRIRRALRRLAPQVLLCEECGGWFGEQDEKPRGLDMCRCSDVEATGPHRSSMGSIPGSGGSNPGLPR